MQRSLPHCHAAHTNTNARFSNTGAPSGRAKAQATVGRTRHGEHEEHATAIARQQAHDSKDCEQLAKQEKIKRLRRPAHVASHNTRKSQHTPCRPIAEYGVWRRVWVLRDTTKRATTGTRLHQSNVCARYAVLCATVKEQPALFIVRAVPRRISVDPGVSLLPKPSNILLNSIQKERILNPRRTQANGSLSIFRCQFHSRLNFLLIS